MLTSLSLRQIFTNLSSNAVKFSQPGGRIEIVTRLLYPCPPGCGPVPPLSPGELGAELQVGLNETAAVAVHGTSAAPAVNLDAPSPPAPVSVTRPPLRRKSSTRGHSAAEKRLSSSNVPRVGALINEKTGSTSVPLDIPLDQIVVRIEVRDAGVGIKLQDARDARLFSPYVQTEIGRYQGGKGTGLGLALVRRIVKLSGGRLGVKSKVRLYYCHHMRTLWLTTVVQFNQGSCFWVELPLGVGGRAIQTSSSDGTGQGFSVRSIPMPVSTIRDFGLPFPDLDEVPSERCGQETPSIAPTLNSPPPTAHFTHRTIMEQRVFMYMLLLSTWLITFTEGLVEMTPSRPDLRWERKPREDGPSYSEEQSRAVPPAFFSEADFGTPVIKPEPLSEPPRAGTTAAPLGTAITTNLPVTPQNPPISESPSSPAKQPLTVLVVDDDQLTRKLMTRMLNRLGCVVTTAEHGAAALEMLLGTIDTPCETTANSGLGTLTPGTGADHQGHSTPRFWDLVLLDNQMPKMSGLEAITRLRAAQRDDLVVGVTGNALIRDQDEYLGAGVDQ
jgi:osomolarity two-component system sensor histidine kinase SLN1